MEQFVCQPSVLELVNKFLGPNGMCRIFAFSDQPHHASADAVSLTSSLGEIESVETKTIVYFIRPDANREVDIAQIEKEVFCGVLTGNTIESLQFLIKDVYVPMLKPKRTGKVQRDDDLKALLQQLRRSALNLTSDSFAHNVLQPVVSEWHLINLYNLTRHNFLLCHNLLQCTDGFRWFYGLLRIKFQTTLVTTSTGDGEWWVMLLYLSIYIYIYIYIYILGGIDNLPIIGIDRLSANLSIIGIGRLPTYTIGIGR